MDTQETGIPEGLLADLTLSTSYSPMIQCIRSRPNGRIPMTPDRRDDPLQRHRRDRAALKARSSASVRSGMVTSGSV